MANLALERELSIGDLSELLDSEDLLITDELWHSKDTTLSLQHTSYNGFDVSECATSLCPVSGNSEATTSVKYEIPLSGSSDEEGPDAKRRRIVMERNRR